ncbi:hypothetical protein Bca52824_093862 [Brassica carinata]|uniref:SCP domain-containing protein n=1 Tax=Brassica carinata TaxID=52824 RepID=A0A8X7TKC2_BRACI|nr:hypothetical protein Bca52824_093862 [Brassica carinata]
MIKSYLRVILLLLCATNLCASSSITRTRTRTITRSRTRTKRKLRTKCLGCHHDSLQFLFRQNLVRAQRLEAPLIWDRRLQNYAQNWANQRKEIVFGENIFHGYGKNWSPADAVVAWASEKRHYNYGSNTCDPGKVCGHYTQMVWKNTRRVGCARVKCNSGAIFMTCNYDPPGNYIGQKPY